MSGKITRRSFIKTGATIGAASLLGTTGLVGLTEAAVEATEKGAAIDICAVTGSLPFIQTQKAIETLGGIGSFVSKGDLVALLPNAVGKNKGSFVHPDILLAVIDLCYLAGAKEIRLIRDVFDGYWSRGQMAGNKEYREMIRSVTASAEKYIPVAVPKGVKLKEAYIVPDLLEFDRLINVAIPKQSTGPMMSGALKNLMGACAYEPTCRFFHEGNSGGSGSDDDFLSQCIADLNTLRTPEFCVMDATVYLKTNGPWGPGELGRSNMVVAGTAPVSVDAFCAPLLGLHASQVPMLGMAEKHGLGAVDVSTLNIVEMSA